MAGGWRRGRRGYNGVHNKVTSNVFLSIGVIGCFALMFGAVLLWRQQKDRRKAVLMAIAALVLLGNVLIIAWPLTHSG
jgi:hypothetical protein